MNEMQIVWNGVYGLAGGLMYAAAGYKASGEPFEPAKFLLALGVGAVTGLGAGLFGIPADNIAAVVAMVLSSAGVSANFTKMISWISKAAP